MTTCCWIAKIVLVVSLLSVAAAISTPKGRLPLALRGVRKMMRLDRGEVAMKERDGKPVSSQRKALAFLLILLAVLIAVF